MIKSCLSYKYFTVYFLFSLLICCAESVWGQSKVLIGEFYYSLDDKGLTATVSAPANGVYDVQDVVIPQSVQSEDGNEYTVIKVANSAFKGSNALKSIVIPGSVTDIGELALADCPNLEVLRLLPSTQALKIENNSGGTNAGCVFNPQGKIENFVPMSVYIERELTGSSSSSKSFLEFTNTVYCEMSGVKTLTSLYLARCSSLETLVLHDGLERIENLSLVKCSSLKELIIPEGTTVLAKDALDELTGLTTLYLPSTLQQVGPAWESAALSDVYCYAKTPPTLSDNKIFAKSKGTVHVYAESVEEYQSSWASKDANMTIVGDLQDTEQTDKLYVTIEGNGTLSLISVNDKPLASAQTVEEGSAEIELEEAAQSIVIKATPQSSSQELESLVIKDSQGNQLPAHISIEGASVEAAVACEGDVHISATFRDASISTLHLQMPQAGVSGLSLDIPRNTDYSFAYMPSEGYRLTAALLDGTPTEIGNKSEDGTQRITIPAFTGEKTLQLIEEGGTITGIIESGKPTEEGICAKEGRLCIYGLRPGTDVGIYRVDGTKEAEIKAVNGEVLLPTDLTGIFIIQAATHTFKLRL